MASVTVRHATIDDASAIVEFQVRMARETQGIELAGPVVQRGVAAVFDDPAKGAYWVAELDGQIVASLLTVPEWSDWRNATVCWVHSVYVEPGARRKGVFSTMYRHLRERVEASADLAGLRLYTEHDNHTAKSVYESLGMSRERYLLYEWLAGETD
jgi:GNAT superfamily N-acetyltransferase